MFLQIICLTLHVTSKDCELVGLTETCSGAPPGAS